MQCILTQGEFDGYIQREHYEMLARIEAEKTEQLNALTEAISSLPEETQVTIFGAAREIRDARSATAPTESEELEWYKKLRGFVMGIYPAP